MPLERQADNWLSAHLYFAAHTIYDTTADSLIAHLAEWLGNANSAHVTVPLSFFIRYSENGPHIRWRMFVGNPRVRQEVKTRFGDHFGTLPDTLRTNTLLAGNAGALESDMASLPEWGLPLRLEWHQFVPEFDRYGGATGVALALHVFDASSRAAVTMLNEIGNDRALRLGKVVSLLALHTFAYCEDGLAAQALLERYCRSVAPPVDSAASTISSHDKRIVSNAVQLIRQRMKAGAALSPTLDHFYLALSAQSRQLRGFFEAGRLLLAGRKASSWEECVRHIVPSYMHMMSNRLGVTRGEELRIGQLLSSAFGDSDNGGLDWSS